MVDGQPAPYPGEDQGGYQVQFFPLNASGELAGGAYYSGRVEEGGKFSVYGHGGEDVPAGKYRVAVLLHEAEEGDEEGGQEDLLGGKYGKENSTLEFEVKPGDNITVQIEGGAAAAAEPSAAS